MFIVYLCSTCTFVLGNLYKLEDLYKQWTLEDASLPLFMHLWSSMCSFLH